MPPLASIKIGVSVEPGPCALERGACDKDTPPIAPFCFHVWFLLSLSMERDHGSASAGDRVSWAVRVARMPVIAHAITFCRYFAAC